MKSGDIVKFKDTEKKARTNAQVLNIVYGTNYKQWMKAAYHKTTSVGTMAWIAFINGKPRNDWKNTLYQDRITEEYVGDKKVLPKGIDEGLRYTTRAVFQKLRNKDGQYYVFRGMYKLSKDSNTFYRVLLKVNDEWQR